MRDEYGDTPFNYCSYDDRISGEDYFSDTRVP